MESKKNLKSKGSSVVRSYYFPQNKKPSLLHEQKNGFFQPLKISKNEECFRKTAKFFEPPSCSSSGYQENSFSKEKNFVLLKNNEKNLRSIVNLKENSINIFLFIFKNTDFQ